MYPCTSCGCCCKRINKAVESLDITDEKDKLYFPYSWDETGKCNNLTPDNRCSIYDQRPLLCNVDLLMEYLNLDKESFYKENIIACNKMMEDDGIDEYFKIIIN